MSTVVDLLKSAGDLSDIERMRKGWPALLVPSVYPDREGPTGIEIQVLLEERRDGVTVMRLRAKVADYCDDIDPARLRRRLMSGMWRNTYGNTQVLEGGVPAPYVEGRVVTEHVIPVEGLTESTINHVVSGFVLGWQRAAAELADERKRFARSGPATPAVAVRTDRAPKPKALARLESMTGLLPVKETVRTLVAMREIDACRKTFGLAKSPSPHHLVFTGNPGTGKTTVARVIAEAYKEMGVLSKGHLVEVKRADLVGAYVGHTALKTKQVCESALGGVLFIDEAYSLVSPLPQDYGHEAIETLMTFMEDNRSDLVVIVAGYPDRMAEFLKSNPGLESRFDRTVEFPDYTETELMEILIGMAAEADYDMGPETRHAAFRFLRTMQRTATFANGREARRLFERIVGNQSRLLVGREGLTAADLRALTPGAVPAGGSMELSYVDGQELI